MLKYKLSIKLYVLSCVLICCVCGDTVVLCLLVGMLCVWRHRGVVSAGWYAVCVETPWCCVCWLICCVCGDTVVLCLLVALY